MALRDYLNFPTRQDLIDFDNVLAHGQAVAILGITQLGDIPQETWYFDENSMSIANNTTVIKPTMIPLNEPGRYHINMVQGDWNALFNKPNFSIVATTGSYNDLINKLSAGNGILINGSNQLAVDGNQFLSIEQANTSFSSLQGSINLRTPSTRTLTINGITQDLSGNRNWQVGNVSTDGVYANPAWITSLSYSKITGTPVIPAAQIQSDWNQVNSGALDFIKNKPNISLPTFNNSATKIINGAGVQISTTKNTRVSYSITHTIALTLLLTSGSSMVYLEISSNNSTWTTINQAGYSDGVSVAVALTKTITNNVQGEIPAGYYVRLRAVTSGAGTATFTCGQETQY